VKGIVIGVLAIACLVMSVIFQPWAEMGFGVDPNVIASDSLLGPPLHALANWYQQQFGGAAAQLQSQIKGKLDEQAQANGAKPDPDWSKSVIAGDYTYITVMAFAMFASAVAIIVIGREDAEEKTVLPVKK
jgi:hypothetical protein